MEVKNTYDIVDDKIGRIYVGRRGFYGLVSKPTNVYRKCPLCGGNKRININGETYTCPKCNGRSTGDMWYSYTQYSLVECYIESIVISSTSYQSSISPVSVNDTQNGCNRNDFKQNNAYALVYNNAGNVHSGFGYSVIVFMYI